jgi:hypothetical protein
MPWIEVYDLLNCIVSDSEFAENEGPEPEQVAIAQVMLDEPGVALLRGVGGTEHTDSCIILIAGPEGLNFLQHRLHHDEPERLEGRQFTNTISRGNPVPAQLCQDRIDLRSSGGKIVDQRDGHIRPANQCSPDQQVVEVPAGASQHRLQLADCFRICHRSRLP